MLYPEHLELEMRTSHRKEEAVKGAVGERQEVGEECWIDKNNICSLHRICEPPPFTESYLRI